MFNDPNPQFQKDTINFNPKMVKYEETTLVMDAWITNGFDYAVYNIHDVTLRISNEEGVIADAYFDELTDLRSERVSRLFGPSTFVQTQFKC